MKVQTDQTIEELKTLGHIGFDPRTGTTRVAYSDAFYEGREYVKRCMENAGLKTRIDSVGNLFGRLEGKSEKTILVGSHIDTVPGGGMYDGALGVFAGIELIKRITREEYDGYYSIEIVAWNEEEGNAVGGTFGSRCFVGEEITPHERMNLRQFGLTEADAENAKADAGKYVLYFELHIEQGGSLEKEGLQIGIVEGIVGIVRYHAQVIGESNHAGSTPMSLRNDAMETSCKIICDLMQTVRETSPEMVTTVGLFDIPGGAVNVIPGRTEFVIEMRNKNIPEMKSVMAALQARYAQNKFEPALFLEQAETSLDPDLTDIIESICQEERYSYKRMFSGAGHDAMNTAKIIPTAMAFIPSIAGVSHCIRERSSDEDVRIGFDLTEKLICKMNGRVGHDN